MSTRISSATNLSATYFMRNFYSNNRDAMKSSKRKEYSITELAYDDSTALQKIKELQVFGRRKYR